MRFAHLLCPSPLLFLFACFCKLNLLSIDLFLINLSCIACSVLCYFSNTFVYSMKTENFAIIFLFLTLTSLRFSLTWYGKWTRRHQVADRRRKRSENVAQENPSPAPVAAKSVDICHISAFFAPSRQQTTNKKQKCCRWKTFSCLCCWKSVEHCMHTSRKY